MSQKFQDTSTLSLAMATDYIDMSCTFIESEGMKYAFDANLSKYFLGLYKDDPIGNMNLINSIRSDILSSQTSNPFINDIHIITNAGVNMISTRSGTSMDGMLETYKETVSTGKRTIEKWIDGHDALDENFSINKDSYIMAFEMLSQSNNACVVIDIKTSAIKDFLEGLDMGEGSIAGFVTKNGREIIIDNTPEGEESVLTEGEPVFFGQDFYNLISEDQLDGSVEVDFKGDDYLFIYSRSDMTGATVCALVPMNIVTGQAEEIKTLTTGLIILACIIVLAVGVLIAMGIQTNMKNISKKFGEVAKGDLTVLVKAKSRDEFRGLASSATNMISNTKKLVNKVNNSNFAHRF